MTASGWQVGMLIAALTVGAHVGARADSAPTAARRTTAVADLTPGQMGLRDALHTARLAGDRDRIMALEEELAHELGRPLTYVPRRTDPDDIRGAVDHGEEQVAGGRWFPEDVLLHQIEVEELRPSLACQGNGTLWAVHYVGYPYVPIWIHRSTDYGATWWGHRGLPAGYDTDPVITVAEGGGHDYLFVVYEAYGTHIRLYREDLATGDYDILHIFDNPDSVANPTIVTDSDEYDNWYAYIAYNHREPDGWALYFSRSLNFGEDWTTPLRIAGYPALARYDGSNGFPDIDYGSGVLQVAYDRTEGPTYATRDVYLIASSTYGIGWGTPVQLTSEPDDEYDPVLGAVRSYSYAPTTVVAYTRDYHGLDADAWYVYSRDAAETWSTPGCIACSSEEELGVNLATSKHRGRIHAVYQINHDIEHREAGYQTPESWSGATIVNQDAWASTNYPSPGVVADPTVDPAEEVCVAWTDFRNQPLTSYDIYFNRAYWPFASVTEDVERAAFGVSMSNLIRQPATIAFQLPGEDLVRLAIHDIEGRAVRRILWDATCPPGPHRASWDGRDDSGAPVASGVYVCRLVAGSGTAVCRAVVVR